MPEECDCSDDEYHIARERVRSTNNKLLHIAYQLQKEAIEDTLNSRKNPTTWRSNVKGVVWL